jgi:hypothetical protein
MRIRQTQLLIGDGVLVFVLALNAVLSYRSAVELHDDAKVVVIGIR